MNYFSYFLQLKLFAKFSQLLNSPQIFLFSVDRFLVKTNPFSHLRLGIMVFTSDTVRKKSACGQLSHFLLRSRWSSHVTGTNLADSCLAAHRGGFPVVSTIPGPARAGLGSFAQRGAGGSLGCGFQAESSPDQFIIMMFLMSTADQMLPLGAVLLEGRGYTGGGRL